MSAICLWFVVGIAATLWGLHGDSANLFPGTDDVLTGFVGGFVTLGVVLEEKMNNYNFRNWLYNLLNHKKGKKNDK